MKIKSFFLVMCLAVSSMSMAGSEDPAQMTVLSTNDSHVFKIIYKSTLPGKVRVLIYGPHGGVIHSETLTGMEGFIYPVNLKGLLSGTYKFEVVSREGRYQKEIAYNKESDRKNIHVSRLQGAEGRYLLSVGNARTGDIQVSIFEQGRGMIFNETTSLTDDFAKVYKLPDPYKKYIFEVSDAGGRKKRFSF